MMRISVPPSAGSALMRLMSASPRGVPANRRPSATTFGCLARMISSARNASASVNASRSPGPCTRSSRAGRRLASPIKTVHESDVPDVPTLKDLGVLQGPPPDLHHADDVLLRHGTPVAAVGTVVAMVAHDEVVALLHDLRAPIVVAAEFLRHVVVVQGNVVDVDVAVHNANGIAFPGDDPLDEHL